MTIRQKLDALITLNYSKYLDIASQYKSKDDPSDILQECLMEICEMNDTKLKKIFPYIEYYLIQMIKYSSLSKKSKYQHKYNHLIIDETIDIKDYIEKNEVDDIEELALRKESEEFEIETYEKIIKILNEHCNWYQRSIFLHYIESGKSFATIQKDTGIPMSSIYNTYNEAKQIIKKNL